MNLATMAGLCDSSDFQIFSDYDIFSKNLATLATMAAKTFSDYEKSSDSSDFDKENSREGPQKAGENTKQKQSFV